jgi:hypothetical protein
MPPPPLQLSLCRVGPCAASTRPLPTRPISLRRSQRRRPFPPVSKSPPPLIGLGLGVSPSFTFSARSGDGHRGEVREAGEGRGGHLRQGVQGAGQGDGPAGGAQEDPPRDGREGVRPPPSARSPSSTSSPTPSTSSSSSPSSRQTRTASGSSTSSSSSSTPTSRSSWTSSPNARPLPTQLVNVP